MGTWVDVTPNDWFYNEVMEASGIYLEDGSPMISGIEYGRFMTDAPICMKNRVVRRGKRNLLFEENHTNSSESIICLCRWSTDCV